MRLVLLAVVAVALGACTSSAGQDVPSPTSPAPASTSSAPATTARSTATPPATSGVPGPRSAAQRAYDRMSERERVGQLLMVDCPSSGVSQATAAAVQRYHVGSVILDGTTSSGMQSIQAVTRQLRGLAPNRVGLFVATDQEGGQVQRLQGPGFDTIPSAVRQGALAPTTLQTDARRWGGELRQAGIDLNLAPVLDTVPAGSGPNPPIGDLDREYGTTPTAVRRHGLAVARGMTAAGVDVTVKHFPGLGRVSGNTDLTAGVTDTVTTRHDPYLAPFHAAVQAGVPFVMMSTAIYTRIDPDNPAAFSPTIVSGMLRGDLGFRGVIISDDVGGAKQVSGFTPGERAVDFVAAGGDVVLTVQAGQAQEMTAALLAKAARDKAFRSKVDAAALVVLQAKQQRGLLD